MTTNPLAFPLAIQAEGSQGSYTEEYQRGMTLRDYFAAAAITGVVAAKWYVGDNSERRAREAYAIADAMLKERNSP